jgi:hypothetical protein
MTSRSRRATRSRRRDAIAWPVLLLLAAVIAMGCIQSVARPGTLVPAAGAGSSAATTASLPPQPTGPTPVPSFVRPTPTPAPTFLVYVVKAGDNLDKIAHRFGTTGRSIAYWNRGTYPSLDPEAAGYSPNLVRVGWILVLIPKVVVDEQTLTAPTPNPTDPSEATPSA